eukprot:6175170-Pleurochrysis_carterae.AAC.1
MANLHASTPTTIVRGMPFAFSCKISLEQQSRGTSQGHFGQVTFRAAASIRRGPHLRAEAPA